MMLSSSTTLTGTAMTANDKQTSFEVLVSENRPS
jgi:translation initiation factor 2B subunit (eIF-2B alpha/beta/delta family)